MAVVNHEQVYRNNVQIQINKESGDGDTLPVFIQNISSDLPPAAVPISPNEIDNSDFDFSKDAYLNNPTVGGDAGLECFNFYRQRFIKIDDAVVGAASTALTSVSNPFLAAYTYPMNFVLLGAKTDGKSISGTITRVSDGAATLSVASDVPISGGILWFGEALAETSANALKSSTHSLFAAETANTNIPRWDNTGGWCETGSNSADKYDIALPLPLNLVRPGLRFYFRLILARRAGSAANTNALRLSAGVWDATSGQDRFIEAGNFGLTVSPTGATGATAYQYKVIARGDGSQIESAVVSIANGNASLSTSNYNRLEWTNVRGILDFDIYRFAGGVYKKIFTISNGNTSYNDYSGTDGAVVGAFPSVGARRAIVYAEKPFLLQNESIWFSVNLILDIPPTYDSSVTTGKQWIRISVLGTLTDVRQCLIDRLMFSLGDGGWNRSNRDRSLVANQSPSVNPTGSDQGGTGIDNPYCFLDDTPTVIGNSNGTNKHRVPIETVEKGMWVDGSNGKMYRVKENKEHFVYEWWKTTLENGIWWECTESERFITSRADKNGTRIDELLEGDDILCKLKKRAEKSAIAEKVFVVSDEPRKINTLTLYGHGKTFVVGHLPEELADEESGAIAHNLKYEYQQY